MMIRKLFIPILFFVFFININTSAQIDADTTQSQLRNPEFAATADQVVQDLTARLTLTPDQAREIKEIFIDYQERMQLRSPNIDNAEPPTTGETEFDTPTDTETETETDVVPETETDIETETETDIETETETETEFDVNRDVTSETSFQGDPQALANKAIEEVLNDTQMTTWTIIKDAWWRDINSRYGWNQDSPEIR